MNNLQKNKIQEELDSLSKKEQKSLKKVTFDQELVDNNIILSVRHLKKYFTLGKGRNKVKLKAVHDVSFDIKKGEVFGIVGESGCGKSTTGRTLIRLHAPTSGSVYFNGYRIAAGNRWNQKEIKWTNVRGKKKIKELKEQCDAEIAQFVKKTTPDQTTINQIKNKYKIQIDNIKLHIKETERVQKEKIKQHNYDNKHVDKHLLTKMQMIFQDPIDSLDPRMTVYDIIAEGLKIQNFAKIQKNRVIKKYHTLIEQETDSNKKEELKVKCEEEIKNLPSYKDMVASILNKVGLIPDYANRYPHEFSGGQRQRIGIARALIMQPDLIIADEPISGLDVSIRAQIINLLNDLRKEFGLTIIFIAHDLSVVKYFSDRIAVMYYGNLVELASADELFKHPLHPYTKALLSAIPKPDPLFEKTRQRIHYDPSKHDYSTDKPSFQEVSPKHFVLCNSKEFDAYKKEIIEEDKKAKENKKVTRKTSTKKTVKKTTRKTTSRKNQTKKTA